MNVLNEAKLEYVDLKALEADISLRKKIVKLGGTFSIPLFGTPAGASANAGFERATEHDETLAKAVARVAEDSADRLIVFLSGTLPVRYQFPSLAGLMKGTSHAVLPRDLPPGSLLLLFGRIDKAEDSYCLSNNGEVVISLATKEQDGVLSEFGIFNFVMWKNKVFPPRKLFFHLTGEWAERFKYKRLDGVVFGKVVGWENPLAGTLIGATNLEITPLAIFSLENYNSLTREIASVKADARFSGATSIPSLSLGRLLKTTREELIEDSNGVQTGVTVSRILGEADSATRGEDRVFQRTYRKFTRETSSKEIDEANKRLSEICNRFLEEANQLGVALSMMGLFTYEEIKRCVIESFRWHLASSIEPFQPLEISRNVYDGLSVSKIAFSRDDRGDKFYIAFIPDHVLERYRLVPPRRNYVESQQEIRELLVDYIIPQNFREIVQDGIVQRFGSFDISWYAFD